MSNKETYRQINMFSGALDDTRTRRQKRLDREREKPHQLEMFSQRDVAQFGVNGHPLLPISENTKLGLLFEDPRTEEEKERDTQLEAERRTVALFGDTQDAQRCLALLVVQDVCRALIPLDLA